MSDAVDRTFRIAIHPDHVWLARDREQSFSARWVEVLASRGHEVILVDALKPDIIEQLRACDAFLWWVPPVQLAKDVALRVMPALAQLPDLLTFPDLRSIAHFDDKCAQFYALEAAGIPTPQTWLFWREAEALTFCRAATYPLVMKLASGFYAINVRLLRTPAEAEAFVRRMFGRGLTALAPSPRSARMRLIPRLHRAASRILAGKPPRESAVRERGYFLVQELVPDNAFDTRVYVVGSRAVAFRRWNRPNDFRASGSGRIDFDPALIALDAIELAFRTAKALGMPSMACDVLRRNGAPVISEISFYGEGEAVRKCPGFWQRTADTSLQWTEGAIRAEDAIIDDILARLSRR